MHFIMHSATIFAVESVKYLIVVVNNYNYGAMIIIFQEKQVQKPIIIIRRGNWINTNYFVLNIKLKTNYNKMIMYENNIVKYTENVQ